MNESSNSYRDASTERALEATPVAGKPLRSERMAPVLGPDREKMHVDTVLLP
jgi:hypothetical protein